MLLFFNRVLAKLFGPFKLEKQITKYTVKGERNRVREMENFMHVLHVLNITK